MMRRFSSAALVAAGALAWSCTVYDSNLVPTDGAMTAAGGDGPATSSSGSSAKAGSVSSSAGTAGTTSSGGNNGQAGSANGGTSEQPEGGTAGTPPSANSGTGGSVGTLGGAGGGAAGKAGSGGTSGTSGASGTAGSTGNGGTAGSAGASGTGGSAGSVAVVKCAEHPLSPKTSWVASATEESLGNGMESDGLYNPAKHMTDGIDGERWSTGQAQKGGEVIQIDFGVPVSFTQVTMTVFGKDVADYPRAYLVRVSNATTDPWPTSPPVNGATGNTTITWTSPVTGQFLSVKQTGMVPVDGPWWTIAEVNVSCTD